MKDQFNKQIVKAIAPGRAVEVLFNRGPGNIAGHLDYMIQRGCPWQLYTDEEPEERDDVVDTFKGIIGRREARA